MNLPRITIVTPSYNQAKYLPETIESILNQNYPNLEYIIIDGGSTDGSVSVIKQYARYLAYWVSEKDSGQSEAINKGLARRTGDLFNWINSDDLLFPGALHKIASTYFQHPDADLIVGDQARTDAEGRVIRIGAAPTRLSMASSRWPLWVGQQSIFLSSNALRRVGGVREDLHCIMDAELYYRILSSGGQAVRVRAPVGLIREHRDAKGQARQSEWRPEKLKIWKEYEITPRHLRIDRLKMRMWRLCDGSYMRSAVALWKWRNKRAWESV